MSGKQGKADSPLDNDDLFTAAAQLLKEARYKEAIAACNELLARGVESPGLWVNLGLALFGAQLFPASAVALKRAVDSGPEHAPFWTSYGNVLTALDRTEEALAAHVRAVELAPDSYHSRCFYALALREAARYEDSVVQFDKALSFKPGDVEAQWWRRDALLCLGRIPEGWKDRELRWQRGLQEPKYGAPRWRGEDLAGKTILLYAEEGHGDNILCSRYIPLIKAKGARILLFARAPLRRLFGSIPGVDRLVEEGNLGEIIHYRCSLMSLPEVFNTSLDTIPLPAPLWVPDTVPPPVAEILDAGKNRFRVGIVWSGNPAFFDNRKRATRLERFLPLAEIPGVQLYSLQKGEAERELGACGAEGLVPALGPHLQDFADTAAVLRKLDLIIMTDSGVAHLAGALGRPVWNLLAFNAYWLYLTQRADSPWYSSMRLFRQPRAGDWDAVFANVRSELARAVKLKKS